MILLHGGPGVSGYLGPLGSALGDRLQVIEPFQRGSGGEPLTVARHVEDLHELVGRLGRRPALVGHSWGAMLALAYAAAHPDGAACLALIGCGTFDSASRARMHAVREDRTTSGLRRALADLATRLPDPDARLRAMGGLLLRIYSFDPIVENLELAGCDATAYEEAWADMIRLQEDGLYPAAFAAIRTPAIMLHGAHDPHPGRMTYETLVRHIPHLEYREWERCGHYPWLEREIHQDFTRFLHGWLMTHLEMSASLTPPPA